MGPAATRALLPDLMRDLRPQQVIQGFSIISQQNIITSNEALESKRYEDSQFLKDPKISHVLNLMTEPNTVINDTLGVVGLRSESGMKQSQVKQKYYDGIELLDMPYPGCEYSAIYAQNGYCGLHCFPFQEEGINLNSMSKLSIKEGLDLN